MADFCLLMLISDSFSPKKNFCKENGVSRRRVIAGDKIGYCKSCKGKLQVINVKTRFRTNWLSIGCRTRRRLLLLRFGFGLVLICAEQVAANIAEPIDSLNNFCIFSKHSGEHIVKCVLED